MSYNFKDQVLESWTLKLLPKGYPEMSVRNYYYSLYNTPEERISFVLRGGSLKSLI
jgi:hypothetical protein